MLSSVLPVLMRSPPMTRGYSLPSWPFTLSIAARIACAFSSLVKSVKGSLRNSVDMIKFGCARLRRALSLDFDNEARQRRAYLSSPLAGLLQFFDFAFDNLALERRHAIKKNDAIAVVRFVQHAARGEFSSVQLEFLSIN